MMPRSRPCGCGAPPAVMALRSPWENFATRATGCGVVIVCAYPLADRPWGVMQSGKCHFDRSGEDNEKD